jgi:hypothetical protein
VTADENGFHWQLGRAGWLQHSYGPPTGHPDRMAAWTGSSTLNRYVDIALSALDDWFDGAEADFPAPPDRTTVNAFAAQHADTLAPGQGAQIGDVLASAFGVDAASQAGELSTEDRQALARSAIAFAALTPEFLLR